MKTKILSIVTILFIVFSVSSKTFAAGNNSDNSTMLTNVNKISQIEVHGNVELYVTSGETDKVKVYDNYYNHNALVQEQDGVLRISSYKDKKLVVWVTVNDLRGISAYDNVIVKSFGKFSSLDFSLNLNNNAKANFDMDCDNVNIAVNDNAKANISGTATQSYMVVNQSATVNTTKFTAEQSIQKHIVPVVAAKRSLDELALN
jgi:hypothetical protein